MVSSDEQFKIFTFVLESKAKSKTIRAVLISYQQPTTNTQ